jgi:sugar phosphate isomerase/epimerase
MNRRNFLYGTLATGALTACSPSGTSTPKPAPAKLGVGLFTLPKMLDKDFAGTMAMLAKLGYQEIETFGPYPFSDPKQIANWAKVTPSLGFSGSGFFGLSVDEVAKVTTANGLSVPSMHTDIDTLQNAMGPLSEAAKALGAKFVVLPAIPAEMRKTLDDYKKVSELFNKIGEDAAKRDIAFAYHNHGYGIKPMDGQIPLDLLLANTDPAKVLLEMDVFWHVAGGADPVEYIKKHSGRYRMFHLKDMKTIQTFSGDGGGPEQWIPLFANMTPIGTGAIDIKAIVEAGRANGAKHFFVEQDNSDKAEEELGKSAQFWKSLA